MSNFFLDEYNNPRVKRITLTILFALLMVVLLLGVIASCHQVEEGELRVVTVNGQASGRVLDSGLSFTIPFISGAESYDVREQMLDVAPQQAGTHDLQSIGVDIRLNYRLDRDNIVEIHKRFGQAYEERALLKAVPEIIKSVTAQYSVAELIQKRDEAAARMETQFREFINTKYPGLFEIVTFSIADLQPSKTFMEAVELKQIAEQEALRKQNEIQTSIAEARMAEEEAKGQANALRARSEGIADARIIEAKARAQAIKMVGDMLKQHPEMLQWEAMKRWDGKLPKVLGTAQMVTEMTKWMDEEE